MSAKLFDIKRYFKKNGKTQVPPPGPASVSPPQPNSPSSQPVQAGEEVVQRATTVVSQPAAQPTTTEVQTDSAQSYSGIGYPPGGGQSYSGIGPPPQSQAAPEVSPEPITTAPSEGTQVTQTTTTTKIQPVEESLPSDPVQPGGDKGTQVPGEVTKAGAIPPAATAPVSQSAIDATKRAGMDVLTRLTQRSNKAILQGVQKAKDLTSRYIDTEHILWGLLTDSGIYQLLSELKVTPKEVQDALEKSFKKENFKGQPQFSPRVKRVLELALSAARSLGFEFISPEHILLAIVQEGEGVGAQVLAKFNVNVEGLNKKVTGKKEEGKEEAKGESTLEQFCQDLTQQAREGKLDPVVARSAEIERVIHILSRRTKNNPCLIGDAGVGKTAIVEGLAQRIVKGDAPEPLLDKRILSLDLMSLIAGARHRGEFEQRLKGLIKEIKAASGQIIVFIDEIQNLVGAGAGEGAMDASNILKPSLARGELQAIGTTTVTEYRKYIEKDPALERRFQPILVAEPTPDQAIEMLHALRDRYEAFHKVSISEEAIEAAVRYSHRYIGNRFLPDKAVDLIDEAAAAIRLPAISLPEEIKSLKDKKTRVENEKKEAEKLNDVVRLERLTKELGEIDKELEELMAAYEEKKGRTTNVVGPEIIAEIVSRWTRIPISRLTAKESDKLLTMEDLLHKRIVDQEAAISAVSEAVRRGRAGLKREKRPIGSFIFMGPTGVGKTETAKALSEILFGSEEMMVRLDMSEYMEKHEVAKLIGAPPGYVGYEEGGQLTEAVRLHPYSVVLLDEIEKAHPDVFNILIQLLDDGRLTDNKGRTISFKNTIVVCTSNIGTGLIQRGMLEGEGEGEKAAALSTFVISPVGGKMITFENRYWFRPPPKKKQDQDQDKQSQERPDWKIGDLTDFFAGQVVVNAEPGKSEQKLPREGIDTHLIMPSGVEIITNGGRFWERKSQVVKEWKTGALTDLFADQVVTNAALDDPTDQLPTAKVGTLAVSPDEKEYITLGDRIWFRENLTTKDWLVESLKDYFSDGLVVSPDQNKKDQEEKKESQEEKGKDKPEDQTQEEQTLETDDQLPTEKLDLHLFTPRGEEIVVFGNRFWRRKSRESKKWKTGLLTELFSGEKVANADPDRPEDQLPVGQKAKKEEETQESGEEKRFREMADKLLEELRKFFKPELLNRFDEVVVFRPLARKHMLAIADLQLKVTSQLLEEQEIGFVVTPAARKQLALIGYDPLYGARPLRRTVQRVIENPISSLIIQGQAASGDLVEVDFDGNEFTFTTKKAPKSQPEEAGQAGKKVPLWRCLDCNQEFEGNEKQPCPACQSEKVKEVKEKEGAPSAETDQKTVAGQEVPPTDAVQAKVEELAEAVPVEAGIGVEPSGVQPVTESGAPPATGTGAPVDSQPGSGIPDSGPVTPFAQYYPSEGEDLSTQSGLLPGEEGSSTTVPDSAPVPSSEGVSPAEVSPKES